ncbi:rhodanese-like domain-containing protein [Symbiobacterium thermophilum]|uniref:Rhodanese-like domain-containing protein n=1 Tax=Symbiobacterium thermophilum TaxID=2734 RepID=A0A953I7H8_SYMTR|nr:rhodanese-like domain-containing protein [Symbiobacterium thermophilum]
MVVFGFGPRIESITTAELQARLERGERPKIIDVREPWEYAEGHVPGAVLKPLGQIRTWARELDRNEEILLICRTASRSAVAYQFLKRLGFTNVKNVAGGMVTWRGEVAR